MNDINEPLYEKINRWLDVLNECSEAVETMAEQYPSEWTQLLKSYDKVIDEMFTVYKNLFLEKGEENEQDSM